VAGAITKRSWGLVPWTSVRSSCYVDGCPPAVWTDGEVGVESAVFFFFDPDTFLVMALSLRAIGAMPSR